MLLKKKRVNVRVVSRCPFLRSFCLTRCADGSMQTYGSYGDKWDVVKLTHTPMSKEEEQEREEALAEVVDPLFPLARADADGSVDDAALGLNGTSAETANAIWQEAIGVFGEE